MHARLAADLWHLSVQNVTGRRDPRVLTNDQRARVFRAVKAIVEPSPTHNERTWNFRETFPRPSPAALPPLPDRQASGLSPEDAPDWDAFAAHTYAELTRGF